MDLRISFIDNSNNNTFMKINIYSIRKSRLYGQNNDKFCNVCISVVISKLFSNIQEITSIISCKLFINGQIYILSYSCSKESNKFSFSSENKVFRHKVQNFISNQVLIFFSL